MNIAYLRDKIKGKQNGLLKVLIMVLVCLLGFGLGRLTKLADRKTPIRISNVVNLAEDRAGASEISVNTRQFVASKNGAKYYPIGCKSADRIKDENRVWFSSSAQAESAGYEPSSTCPQAY